MFSLLKKAVVAGVAAVALGMTLGSAMSADSAQARPAYMKIDGVEGSATAKDHDKSRLKRVTPRELRRILRKAKPRGLKRTPRPPARPGGLSAGGPGGGTIKGGTTCNALGYCFCSGADHCNVLIAVCAEVGGHLSCTDHDSIGRPTECSCFK